MKTIACVSWNETTQTCEAQAWVEYPTVLPPLSVSDALVLSGKIAFVWVIAWTFRFVARFIWRG